MGLKVPMMLLQWVTATSLVFFERSDLKDERGSVKDEVSRCQTLRLIFALSANLTQGPMLAMMSSLRESEETFVLSIRHDNLVVR